MYGSDLTRVLTEPFWHVRNADMAWYALPRELSLSPNGKLLQHPVREAVKLRQQHSTFPALADGAQVEITARCERPKTGSWPASGLLAVKTLQATGQALTLGYEFGAGAAIRGFADVPASLSVLGARKDVTPNLFLDVVADAELELRVFVDGHMAETFFGGHAVITTITSNTLPSAVLGSAFVNSARLNCSVSSWKLAL
eukprot:COSAG01_NODE_5321_length_4335_cov_3.928234_4_plen_199_part_00